jgi:glutamate-ammonia-ligase adenylyltransferase
LTEAARLGLVDPADATSLAEAWLLATRLRNAGVLLRGRMMEGLPSDVSEAEGLARVMRRPAGSGQELADEYRRVTRHARAAYERVFFGT